MQNRSLQRNMYRKSPRNRPFFTDRSSTKFAPKNPSIFPRNRAFIDANLTLKKPRNLTFSHDLSKPVVHGVFFFGVGGVGKYFFLLQTLTDHSAQCMQKACIGPTRFALKNSTQWTTECPNHFYDAIRLLKIGINSLFCAEIFDPFDCKLDVALLWFHHHRKSRMISR